MSDGFTQGAWLKNSRAVSDWDGSNGALADFYECASINPCSNCAAGFPQPFGWMMCHAGNSRVQITTWAGGYSRREWSGMVTDYYGGRTKVWLNNTLHQMALASVEDGTTTGLGADIVRSA